jgi:hypothetical protein
MGFESDAEVFTLTEQNVAALAFPIEIVNADYRSGTDRPQRGFA